MTRNKLSEDVKTQKILKFEGSFGEILSNSHYQNDV
jgi:hypothetical protein